MTALRLIGRDECGLRPPTRPAAKPDLHAVRSVTVHWTGPSPGGEHEPSPESTMRWCRGMQRWHQDHHGWSDLVYSYAVGRDGTAVSVRGLTMQAYAEGRSRRSETARYADRGRSWPEIYGLTDPPRSFDARTLSVVTQLGVRRDGTDEAPAGAMTDALAALIAHLSHQLGRDLYVDVHRSHRIKPCPGPHLAHLAESGRLGRAAEGAEYTTRDEAVRLALDYIAGLKHTPPPPSDQQLGGG